MKVFFALMFLLLNPVDSIFGANQHRLNKTFLNRQFDSKKGLQSNQVTHIFQDKKGYLWLSHWRGFCQFDGKNFRNYKDTDGLFASSTFEAIEFSPNHFLLQHIKGISIFEPEKSVQTVPFPDSIHGLRIGKALYQNNDFWIFNCYSNTSEKIYHLKYDGNWNNENSLNNDTVLNIIHSDNASEDYIFTKNSIHQLRDGKLTRYGLLKHKYKSFSTDQKNICWGFSTTDSQFYTIYFNNSMIREVPSGIFAENLTSKKTPETFVVLPDDEGIVYYTDQYELFKSNNFEKKSLGCSFNLIREMIVDKEKNLWIATEEGIFNFYRLDFERIKLLNSDKSDMIWSLAQLENNRIIAGRFGFGFVELMDSVWKPVSLNYAKDHISGMELFSPYMGAVTTTKMEAWFPVWKGLIRFKKTGEPKIIPLPATPEQLYIDPKSPDTIYAAATKGMLTIDSNANMTYFGPTYGFSNVQYESITKDRYGRFWLGSSQGSTQIFDKNKVLPPSETPNISNVISSQKDSKGNLWFGTDKGLFYYDYKNLIQISPNILNGSIDLLINYNDSILVGIGLNKLGIINYQDNKFEISIHEENELTVMQNSYLVDQAGYIWFSSMYDLVRFNPLVLLKHEIKEITKPIITSVEYSSDNVNWIKTDSTGNIKAKYSNLKFKFIALTYRQSELLTYRTYLENFNTWSGPSKSNEISYTNLKPGKYKLAVQSSVDGQNWSPVTYSEPIEIYAFWYQKIWIRLMIISILFLAFFFLSYSFISASNKRKINKLTEQRKLNLLQLQLVHSKQIPHFSGNALANIEHFIFNSDVRQANKYLSLFSRFLNQTMEFADQPCLPLKQELELARIYLELEVMRFENKFGYKIDIDPNVDQKIKIPNMLLHTWVENAVKHGLRHKQNDGMIHISATQQNDILVLSVEDNGIGRKKAKEMGTSGSGRGLSIISEQIEIYNNFNENQIQFSVTDLKNQIGDPDGTRFTIYIPVIFNYDF
ncbi:MAG: two-component regulator propeller domain-containing protein [Prolixibacteraceae bacterium]